jgi:NAD(P)-dependent dehydrogenase (short-subunit alcohol dehydrogenase family)
MPMHGKVVLVTGAGSALGRAVIGAFTEQRALVYGADLVSPVPSLPFGVEELRLDVTSERGWSKAIADIVDETGRLDVLVNQAGIGPDDQLVPWNVTLCMKQLAMDLAAMCLGMSEVVPVMRQQRAGSIINISSAWRGEAAGADLARHAAKGAVRAMSRSAAMTHAVDGIRINSVHAGLGDMHTPIDVAHGCLFLSSCDATGLNGGELLFGVY